MHYKAGAASKKALQTDVPSRDPNGNTFYRTEPSKLFNDMYPDTTQHEQTTNVAKIDNDSIESLDYPNQLTSSPVSSAASSTTPAYTRTILQHKKLYTNPRRAFTQNASARRFGGH